MTILNNILDNGIIFYYLYEGVATLITFSFIKSVLVNRSSNTTSLGEITDLATEKTITPKTFDFTHERLSQIKNHIDQAVQVYLKIRDEFIRKKSSNNHG